MADRILCDLCGRAVLKHASYVVRMDVFADPSIPPLSTDDLDETSFDETLDKLMDEMKDMTTGDLQDDVHRRFEFHVCRECQRRVLANPLGKPRTARPAEH